MQMSSFVICRLAMFVGKDHRMAVSEDQLHTCVSVTVGNCRIRMDDVQVAFRRPGALFEVMYFTSTTSKACEHRGNDSAQIPSPRDDVVLFWRQNAAVPNFNLQIWRNSLGKREIYKQFTWNLFKQFHYYTISRPRDHPNRFSLFGTQ